VTKSKELMSFAVIRESGSWGESFRWRFQDADGVTLSRPYPTTKEVVAEVILILSEGLERVASKEEG
jgi:hypothetical protein